MRFFLIAGEPSGDALGAALMAGLRDLSPGVAFDGIGGPLMQGQGLVSRFPMQELTLMGLTEVLPRYFHLKRRIEETAQAVAAERPAALITIDSPDFCLRVARRARALWPDLRVIHYVAPSVWAWRPGRAAKMAPVVDHVLALLPFEPPYMQAAGMSCDFVGHPIATATPASADQAAAFRAAHGIAADAPLVLCLPGSRRGEIRQLTARFGETLGLVAAQVPGLRVVLPTLDNLRPEIEAMTRNWPLVPLIVTGADDKLAAFAAADAALAASGTVSLELALNAVPMVIAYDMAPLSRWIILRMMLTDTVTLVNLVSETRAVPEFIAANCRPAPMADALVDLLRGGAARQAQLDAMALTMRRLGQGGEPPGHRAARSVLAAITAPQPR
ncbi:MAG: lipid-A-disaccharide synthase [Paracoccus sp. (in: a-proteobacteria)]|uniref:lipid-A-disaccharide synthase n=1 Tax=Paracoccus sp. TaxID=267 RepID=UPI0026E06702|nr:lipid-A-disaccharide synthase [Paracoccus sp. (in: a-proteobacteria)]MDO5631041.1 lipid-A-disaccharide synthase [Paracoccus sp. (in: a-proteobacteria)]